MNKQFLIGNVGTDPDMKNLPNGTPVAKFSLATSKKWKDQSGETQEKTTWHRIVVFGKRAEVVAKYVQKGSKLFIEGETVHQTWDKPDGSKGYSTEVHMSNMEFLGGNRNSDNQQGGSQNYQQNSNQRQPSNNQQGYNQQNYNQPTSSLGGPDLDDDVPF